MKRTALLLSFLKNHSTAFTFPIFYLFKSSINVKEMQKKEQRKIKFFCALSFAIFVSPIGCDSPCIFSFNYRSLIPDQRYYYLHYSSLDDLDINRKPSLSPTTPKQLNIAPFELTFAKENLRKVSIGEAAKRKPPRSQLCSSYVHPVRRMSDSVLKVKPLQRRPEDISIPEFHQAVPQEELTDQKISTLSSETPESNNQNEYVNEDVYGDATDIQDLRKQEPWFFPFANRDSEEELIRSIGLDGTYLVRKSNGDDIKQPFTLTVFYNSNLIRLRIRYLSTGEYALGNKKDEEVKFSSVEALVTHYQTLPLILLGPRGGQTLLKYIPNKF